MVAVAIVVALTFVGSDGLAWFDAALVGYLFGLIFAVFGVVYRYAVWVRRPPTAMLNRRGWDAFRQRKSANLAALPGLVGTQLLAQGFIRRRSRARWLAHQLVFWGCILAALVTFPLTLGLLHFESVGQQADRYQVYVSRVGTLKLRRRQPRRLDDLPRPRHRRRPRARRSVHLPATAVARSGGPGDGAQQRLPGPRRAVRRVGDRPVPHRVQRLARRAVLLGAEHDPRPHRDPRPDVLALRQVVPHLPAAGKPRSRLLQTGQRRRPGGAVPTLRRALRQRPADQRPEGRAARRRVRLQRWSAAATTRTPARAAGGPRSPSPSRRGSEGSADGPPADHRRRARRPIRTAPQRSATGRLERRDRGRPGRRDALLLLRAAVRHQAEGPRQRRGRIRAVVRVPVQQGHVVPEGCQALPPGQPPRPLVAPDGTRPVSAGRVPPGHVGSGPRPGRRRDPPDPGGVRQRRLRHALRRLADQREELSDRQVRPPRLADRQPRLQRPLLHGVGRRRQQEGPRHRPRIEPVERHPAGRCRVGRWVERRRDVSDHHELHLAGARPWRQADRPRPPGGAVGPHCRRVPRRAPGHRFGPVRGRAPRADPSRLARPRPSSTPTPSDSTRPPQPSPT